MSDKDRGIYLKYTVTKADGSPVDEQADYFVLRVDKDPAARAALLAYGRACDNPSLAADILYKVAVEYAGELVGGQRDRLQLRLAELERLHEEQEDTIAEHGTDSALADQSDATYAEMQTIRLQLLNDAFTRLAGFRTLDQWLNHEIGKYLEDSKSKDKQLATSAKLCQEALAAARNALHDILVEVPLL